MTTINCYDRAGTMTAYTFNLTSAHCQSLSVEERDRLAKDLAYEAFFDAHGTAPERTEVARPALRFETVTKGYRKLALAYRGNVLVGHVGWCPAAVRNRRAGLTTDHPTAGRYSAWARGQSEAVGMADTLAQAKTLLTSLVA